MKILVIIIILFISYNCFSQKFSPIEINTAGDNEITNDYSFTYSVGGLAVNTLSNESILTQGFQQNYNIYISEFTYFSENHLKAKVFPNPTTDIVFLSVQGFSRPLLCYIEVIDNYGNIVSAPAEYYEFGLGQNISINMEHLSPGPYILFIISKKDNERIAQVKFIKL